MRQAKIVIRVIHRQLLAHAGFLCAYGGDTPPHRRHMLADIEVEALHKGRVDLPALRGQHLLNSRHQELLDLVVSEDVRRRTWAAATEHACWRNLVPWVFGGHEP